METLLEERREIEHREKESIHLFVEGDAVGDSTVRVRWCICQGIAEELRNRNVQKPQIFMLVCHEDRYDWKEDERKLLPLEQEMTYIYFKGAGHHRILAAIVWHEKGKVEKLKELLLERDWYGKYKSTIFNDSKGDFYEPEMGENVIGKGIADIAVDEKLFAKKPAKWLWKWGNFCHRDEPVDQCHFRKRLVLAFTLKPIGVLLWVILMFFIRSLAAPVLLLFGMRDISFETILHPFQNKTEDIWSQCESMMRNKDGKLRLFLLPFVPISILVVALLAFPACILRHRSPYLYISITLGILLFLSICLYIFQAIIERIGFKWVEGLKRKQKSYYEQEISPLVCTGVPLEAKLGAIPFKRRTFHLRFMDLKTKVCKPFAKY